MTTTTTTTAFARSGGKLDRVGISRNPCTTSKERTTFPNGYKTTNLSSGANQQAALAMDNQKKKNVTTLQTAQSEADAEIERQRKLLAEQYSAAIQKAQADNDMVRAQQLYEAAKQEEAQLLALRQEAGKQLAALGDNSVVNSLLQGGTVARDTTSQTWDGVTGHEDEINRIYDSAMESDQLAAQMVLSDALSQLEAKQKAATAATDKNLTQTYVDALKKARNYNEVQGAYGLGSGNMAQAKLAQALGLTEDLTDQRSLYTDTMAGIGGQRLSAQQSYRDTLAKAMESNEYNRAQDLYKAAEDEEQALISTQQTVGKALAEQGDYSILKKLWGLTDDQVDRLQGTGIYSPYYGNGGNPQEEEIGVLPGASDITGDNPIDLGYGPISQQELDRLVAAGEVIPVDTGNGVVLRKVASHQPLFYTNLANDKVADYLDSAISNLPSSKEKESVVTKIVDAIVSAVTPKATAKSTGGGSFGDVDIVTEASSTPKTTKSKKSSGSAKATSLN